MSKRSILFERARRWRRQWCKGKSIPTLEMAYIAGYQAHKRDMEKINARASTILKTQEPTK